MGRGRRPRSHQGDGGGWRRGEAPAPPPRPHLKSGSRPGAAPAASACRLLQGGRAGPGAGQGQSSGRRQPAELWPFKALWCGARGVPGPLRAGPAPHAVSPASPGSPRYGAGRGEPRRPLPSLPLSAPRGAGSAGPGVPPPGQLAGGEGRRGRGRGARWGGRGLPVVASGCPLPGRTGAGGGWGEPAGSRSPGRPGAEALPGHGDCVRPRWEPVGQLTPWRYASEPGPPPPHGLRPELGASPPEQSPGPAGEGGAGGWQLGRGGGPGAGRPRQPVTPPGADPVTVPPRGQVGRRPFLPAWRHGHEGAGGTGVRGLQPPYEAGRPLHPGQSLAAGRTAGPAGLAPWGSRSCSRECCRSLRLLSWGWVWGLPGSGSVSREQGYAG